MDPSTSLRTPIRVVAIDDSEEFLAVLASLVCELPWMTLVGTARDGESGLEVVERLRPDLVLMDAVMPNVDGFAATRRIKSRPNAPKVVIVTFLEGDTARIEAKAAGADGCMTKSELADELVPQLSSLWREAFDRPTGSRTPVPFDPPPSGASRPKPSS